MTMTPRDSEASLSLGVIVISLMTWLRVDLMGYLFGDILAVSLTDLYWVYGGGMLVLVLLVLLWRPLLARSGRQSKTSKTSTSIPPP